MEIYKLTKPSYTLTDEEIVEIASRHKQMTFDEIVEEFLYNTKATIGEEVMEYAYPPPPFKITGPPWEFQLTLDEDIAKRYADQTGIDDPLYCNPEYAAKTRYGCLIGYPTFLAVVRYPAWHGFLTGYGEPSRSKNLGIQSGGGSFDWPLANFLSGNAWEWFDVIKAGTRFKHNKTAKEVVEKKGSKGRLIFLITEIFHWNTHGDLLGKAEGVLIDIPLEARHDEEHRGEQMIYDRPAYKYSKAEMDKIVSDLENEERRGAEPRYWEDVNVGDKLPTVVMPPWSGHDIGAYRICSRNYEINFENIYRLTRDRTEPNPITKWPYSFGAEHEDALLAKYRGLPAVFDLGVQRFQIPARVLTSWMGDDGFIRRMYTTCMKPVFWGDTTWYSGEVVKKFKVTEKGEAGPGGVPGEAEYCAVGIKIEGKNQLGEMSTPGTARIYLPSREFGPVKLPVPHPPKPPYVPFEEFRKEWY